MRVFTYTLLSGGNMASSINSPLQSLNQMQIASLQAVWTGSPTGTLKVQISNDDPLVVGASNVNWTDYSNSSTPTGGAGGNFIWNLLSTSFNCVRVVYTSASGTGSLNVTVSGKGPS